MSLLIRPATAADSARIAEVYIRSFRDLIPGVTMAHTDEQVRAWIKKRVVPSGLVTVAARDGEIVGMMSLEPTPECSWIHHLYVHPKEIGRGVGTALLHHAMDTLPRPIRLHTFQSNLRARDFYKRHGFTPIAYGDGSENEEGAPDMLLQLSQ
ncbi:MAG TPA: GNAT family N-acetyltransferase [Candidatus Eisenbacteria bacterium]|nr:GNAT family N-acetyltransferase [Candidatus Eisenbacteria bacterium]